MAKTKLQRKNELATIAFLMDQHLREDNEKMEKHLKAMYQAYKKAILDMRKEMQQDLRRVREAYATQCAELQTRYLDYVWDRNQRIQELEDQWEGISDSLHNCIEENIKLKVKIRNLEEQLLDQSEVESDTTLDSPPVKRQLNFNTP